MSQNGPKKFENEPLTPSVAVDIPRSKPVLPSEQLRSQSVPNFPVTFSKPIDIPQGRVTQPVNSGPVSIGNQKDVFDIDDDLDNSTDDSSEDSQEEPKEFIPPHLYSEYLKQQSEDLYVGSPPKSSLLEAFMKKRPKW